MSKFTESDVEEAALYYFGQLGYTILGRSAIYGNGNSSKFSVYGNGLLNPGTRLWEWANKSINH